ncbi:MAG: hypothetical protein JAZ02_06205 [Candidatus Thiodiazotropha endolucinida]|nr:hypothetical protein [Candidatus Thiodiazotropha endolucinida]
MDAAIDHRYQEIKNLAQEIVDQLRNEVGKLGFAPDEVRIMNPKDAEYRLELDPSNNEYSLVGDWFDAKGQKLGCLLFHADGSFYVEHDVVKSHPTKRRWFVEAVNAWGKDADIKAEARLLPLPD